MEDVSWGEHLKQEHDRLRTELATLIDEVDGYFVEAGASTPRPAPPFGVQLRTRCLAVCAAVHEHHSHEDSDGFAFVESARPELAPTIARLRSEHVVVADILTEIGDLIDGIEQADPVGVRTRLGRLAERLDEHFAYEEGELVKVLDELQAAMA